MTNSLWVPIVGMWCIYMIMGMMVMRTRDVVRWLSLCADAAVFALLAIAVVVGMAIIGEGSEKLLGVPKDWAWGLWISVCIRCMVILKGRHEKGKLENRVSGAPELPVERLAPK